MTAGLSRYAAFVAAVAQLWKAQIGWGSRHVYHRRTAGCRRYPILVDQRAGAARLFTTADLQPDREGGSQVLARGTVTVRDVTGTAVGSGLDQGERDGPEKAARVRDHEVPTGAEHPLELVQYGQQVGDMSEGQGADHEVDPVVR